MVSQGRRREGGEEEGGAGDGSTNLVCLDGTAASTSREELGYKGKGGNRVDVWAGKKGGSPSLIK